MNLKASLLTAEGICAYYKSYSKHPEDKLKVLLNFQQLSDEGGTSKLTLYAYACAFIHGKYGKLNEELLVSDEHAPTEQQVYKCLVDKYSELLENVTSGVKQEFVPEKVTIH